MWFKIVFIVTFAFNISALKAQSLPEDFNIEGFYRAFSSEDIGMIEEQLKLIDPASSISFKAYMGALTMKKSGMLRRPKDKLDAFKQGRELLEEAISQDAENGEFRFLRLVIQEKAPGILKYNDKKEEDSRIVVDSFSDLPEIVQGFVKDYAKSSEALALGKLD